MITTSRQPIAIGIVGLGRAGIEMHLEELARMPQLFTIKAVCDLVKERRDIVLSKLPNCRTYRRYEDMLADHDIELVDIATRSDDHAAHVLQALKTSKWVHVERPMCCTADEAQIIRAAALKAGNKLLVRHNYHFEPAFVLAQQAIESSLLGDIYDIRIRRGIYTRRDDWQTIKRCGGGAALMWCTGFMDQALEFLKTPPTKVWADFKREASVGDAEDYVRIILKNLSDVTVELEVSGARIGAAPLFTITGTRGEFTVYPGATEGVIRHLDPHQKLPRRRSSVRIPPLGAFGTPETLVWKETHMPMPDSSIAGMDKIWEAVFMTIREGRPFPVPLDTAIEIMRILTLLKKESAFAL